MDKRNASPLWAPGQIFEKKEGNLTLFLYRAVGRHIVRVERYSLFACLCVDGFGRTPKLESNYAGRRIVLRKISQLYNVFRNPWFAGIAC